MKGAKRGRESYVVRGTSQRDIYTPLAQSTKLCALKPRLPTSRITSQSAPTVMAFLSPSLVTLVLGVSLILLPSCNSTNRLLKAKPTALSKAFDRPSLATDCQRNLPFQKLWITPDRKMKSEAMTKKKLYVAPVSLAQLRPVAKPLIQSEIATGYIDRNEMGMAAQLRREFIRAFQQSPRPRYQVVSRPGKDTLTLQLSIIELSPTSARGNAAKTAIGLVIGPLSGLAGRFTKGNMAIEGKLLDSKSGKTFIQFADNESDRMTLYSLRDYKPYGHAVHAMQAWADQFELLSRTPAGGRINDSACLTLWPY